MSVFDDPRGKLQWLEDELLEEDEEEEYEEEEEEEVSRPLFLRRKQKPSRTVYAGERQIGDDDAVFVEKKKKRKVKGVRRLKFLAFVEIMAILAVLWWWIKWLY